METSVGLVDLKGQFKTKKLLYIKRLLFSLLPTAQIFKAVLHIDEIVGEEGEIGLFITLVPKYL